MKRSGPLRPSRVPTAQRSALPKANAARLKALFRKQFDSPEFVQWIKRLPCSIDGCDKQPSYACHAVSRGAGGTAADVLPMCALHHSLQHRLGIESFQVVFSVNLKALAASTWDSWPERQAGA